jgi:hypothetical protein
MAKKMTEDELWTLIKSKLDEQGIQFEELLEIVSKVGEADVRVVCATCDLHESIRELGETNRDQVVMVRVDEGTATHLDLWTETGAVKSRSEAAALFIREGLKVRSKELAQLEGSIRDVQKAKTKLKQKAKTIFGEGTDE